MTDDQTKKLFDAALARLLDGEAEPGDGELIARVARQSPELIRAVSGLALIDDLLRQHAEPRREMFIEGLVERLEADSSGSTFVRRMKAQLHRPPGQARGAPKRWVPWFLAVAACAVAAVGWWRALSRAPDAPRLATSTTAPAPAPAPASTAPAAPASPTSGPNDSMALLVNQAKARFAEGAAPDAVSFAKGHYSLTEGSAHLRFRTGADVVIVAPTQFVIDDAMRLRVESGTIRALVPVSAHGFMVVAPGVQYRDLGTEFGVKVNGKGGESELHVFDGQVEVYHDGATKPQRTVLGGESVKMVAGVLEPAGPAAEGEFPTANSISLSRWNGWRKEFRADPDLVFYYPFVADPADAKLLRDEAEHGAGVPGRIEGAEWVTGRWPGKKALQFEDAGDGVSLKVPGEFDQATFAAWLKIDRMESAEHEVLSSVGWGPGGVQWQFNRRGSVASTAVFSDPKRRVIWADPTPLPVGQWFHWAVTIDRETGRILHYVDGKLVCEARVAPGALISPGPCYLGRWESNKATPDPREFRGRIDELAMWRVALPARRIAELAEAGMPVELPEPPPPGGAAGEGRAAPSRP